MKKKSTAKTTQPTQSFEERMEWWFQNATKLTKEDFKRERLKGDKRKRSA